MTKNLNPIQADEEQGDSTIVLPSVAESPEQAALYRWFTEQYIQSIDNLEGAARQIITLCTTLLGGLLGLMALTGETLPFYMAWPFTRWASGIGVGALLLAIFAAITVIMPQPNDIAPNDPDSLEKSFKELLEQKYMSLCAAIFCFGVAMFCIAAVVIWTLVYGV